MDHWWDSNPAFLNNVPRGWLLTSNKRLVGFLGNIPSLFQLNGVPSTIYNATTWRVLSQYRAHSLRLLSKFILGSENSIAFDTSPTQSALKMLKVLGFKQLPGTINSSSVAVTAPERFLQRLIPPITGAELAKDLIGNATQKLSGLVPHRKRQKTTGFCVRLLPKADHQFDELWDKTRHTFHYTRIRTAANVNWHHSGEYSPKKILFGCYQGSELVGYMICLDNVRARLRPLECLDIWTMPPHREPVSELIAAALQYGVHQRCGVVKVPHLKPFIKNACAEIGLSFRKPSDSMVYAKVGAQFVSSIYATNSYLATPQADSGP